MLTAIQQHSASVIIIAYRNLHAISMLRFFIRSYLLRTRGSFLLKI